LWGVLAWEPLIIHPSIATDEDGRHLRTMDLLIRRRTMDFPVRRLRFLAQRNAGVAANVLFLNCGGTDSGGTLYTNWGDPGTTYQNWIHKSGNWPVTWGTSPSANFQGLYGMSGVLTVVVPEPSTLALATLGLLGLIGFGRRRKR